MNVGGLSMRADLRWWYQDAVKTVLRVEVVK
jgi:hypothetical protein